MTVCRCSPPCVLKVQVHDGLEFVVPTWCPTPQPWNRLGAWLDHTDTARRVAAIKAAIPNCDQLRAESFGWEQDHNAPGCGTYWGSHGCDRPLGHTGLCVCGTPDDPCSAGLKYGDGQTFILWFGDDDNPSELRWEWYR